MFMIGQRLRGRNISQFLLLSVS